MKFLTYLNNLNIQNLSYFVRPILSKPKPKPKPVEEEATKEGETTASSSTEDIKMNGGDDGDAASTNTDADKMDSKMEASDAAVNKAEMDLD